MSMEHHVVWCLRGMHTIRHLKCICAVLAAVEPNKRTSLSCWQTQLAFTVATLSLHVCVRSILQSIHNVFYYYSSVYNAGDCSSDCHRPSQSACADLSVDCSTSQSSCAYSSSLDCDSSALMCSLDSARVEGVVVLHASRWRRSHSRIVHFELIQHFVSTVLHRVEPSVAHSVKD